MTKPDHDWEHTKQIYRDIWRDLRCILAIKLMDWILTVLPSPYKVVFAVAMEESRCFGLVDLFEEKQAKKVKRGR